MSMTTAQAIQLGRLIAKARAKKGLSTRAVATHTGLSLAWLGEVEAGKYLDPAADRLARLASVLDIEPSRIDRLMKGAMRQGLPEPKIYFRAKMAMTPEQTDQVMRYIERMRKAA